MRTRWGRAAFPALRGSGLVGGLDPVPPVGGSQAGEGTSSMARVRASGSLLRHASSTVFVGA